MGKRGMTPKTAEKVRIRKGIDKGTKLRRQRVKKGLSQSELSALSGVPLKTVQRYEQNPLPINSAKINTLVAICFVLDCKIEDVLENEMLILKYKGIK